MGGRYGDITVYRGFPVLQRRTGLRQRTDRSEDHPKIRRIATASARSAMISARLDLERARIAGETLQLLGLPAFLLNERGGVVFANHLATTLGDYLQWRAHDRIAFKDVHVSSFFEHLVSSIDRKQVKPPVRSFAVQNEDGRVMVAHLIPIRGAARDIFARCASVLVMTSTRPRQVPSAELIQSLFDLTPAETRVARGLASGQTPMKLLKRLAFR